MKYKLLPKLMKPVLLVIIQFGALNSFSQLLNQDAEGKSTILIDGGAIGLDITQTEAGFTYNQRLGKPGTHQWILGGTGKSKNETGIAGLFDNGKFVPGGSLSLRIGGSRRYGFSSHAILMEEIDALIARFNELSKKPFLTPRDSSTLYELDSLINAKRSELNNVARGSKNKTLTWYLDGGFAASKFFLYNPNSTVDSTGSFVKKENFTAGNLQFGINYQCGSWINGFSIGYEKANNLNDLTSTKTEIIQADTLQDGTINRNTSRETYKKSEYKVFDKVSINYDLIKIFRMGSKTGNPAGFFAFNILYLRYGMTDYTSRFKLNEKENNRLNLGTGIHFFDTKGKFLGGFYAQANNLTNWDNSMTFSDKISFGIYTRFNIKAISVR